MPGGRGKEGVKDRGWGGQFLEKSVRPNTSGDRLPQKTRAGQMRVLETWKEKGKKNAI